MRVAIATVGTPPIRGGAEFLADGLADALRAAGHSVHKLVAPFSFAGVAEAERAMERWEGQDFRPYGGGGIDRVICLKFPTWLLQHGDSVAWLLHQHRPAYELFGGPYGLDATDGAARDLRARIVAADSAALGALRVVRTISQRVSDRLLQNNGVPSSALYHPPHAAAEFYAAPAQPYLLVPSRLEGLKRQDLLLRALELARPPALAVLVGEGGGRAGLERLAGELGIGERVRFLGGVGRRHLIDLYARAAAIFFGPLDEDYGYVTLEAMLAEKPVITCRDSGGPLEFVADGETGWVVEPEPAAIAAAIDRVFDAPAAAAALGRAGRARYDELGLSWERVADELAGPAR